MAKTIRYGSTGDDVRKLQQQLNQSGYNLAVDGSFGNATKNAVTDYQTKNNLTADGIVGNQTWQHLNTASVNGAGAVNEQQNGGSGSDNASNNGSNNPLEQYQQLLGNAPGGYTGGSVQAPAPYESKYDDQINAIYQKIMGQGGFQFDLANDPLYAQYREQYQNLGRQAMEDTTGTAAGLTGGYGSSYGQAVGQQQYQAYLDKLNSVVPELYDRQRADYDAQQSKLLNQYQMLLNAENRDYGRYQDAYNQYLAAENQAYSRWQDQYNLYLNQLNNSRSDAMDIAKMLAASGDYSYLQQIYGMTDEQIQQLQQSLSGSSGSNPKPNTNPESDTPTTDAIRNQAVDYLMSMPDFGNRSWTDQRNAVAEWLNRKGYRYTPDDVTAILDMWRTMSGQIFDDHNPWQNGGL